MCKCVAMTVVLVLAWILKSGAFIYVYTKDGAKENVGCENIGEYAGSALWDMPMMYGLYLFAGCGLECLASALMFGEWFMFFDWWTVGVLFFPCVFAHVYVRYCLAHYKGNGGVDSRKRLRERGLSLAKRMLGGEDDAMYGRYRDGLEERLDSGGRLGRYGLCRKDALPQWLEDNITLFGTVFLGAHSVLLIIMLWCR